ncbi:NlpC/P60 family protein [Actinomadura vinacea]|uniref:NlpC/P60 family protein n=1 Tax=Actinomadura vinacea TaxID=115336 RepID=A0ABN3JD50_9ACTN
MAGLGCLGGIVAVVMVPFLIGGVLSAVLSLGGGSGGMPICSTSVVTGAQQPKASGAANSIPRNYFDLYQRAAAEWNVPWTVLAGIGSVETHHGTLKAAGVLSGENHMGAGGPMQFLQGTFERAKVDGNGDGVTSRYDPADAIFSAAKLLKLHIVRGGSPRRDDGGLKERTLTPEELRRSIHRYNPTPDYSYLNKVLAAQNGYAEGYNLGPDNDAGQGCSPLGVAAAQAGPFGQRIINSAVFYARRDPGKPNPPNWIGRLIPYSWGGGNGKGPSRGIRSDGNDGTMTVGFDCSGLALHAVYQASNGQVTMPRTAGAMFHSNKGVRVPRNQLAPGDLVFFNGYEDPGHMAIFYGEFAGKRWMVEAPQAGDFVKFSEFDTRSNYVGSLRVAPPPGLESPRPPGPRGALSGAGVGGSGAM